MRRRLTRSWKNEFQSKAAVEAPEDCEVVVALEKNRPDKAIGRLRGREDEEGVLNMLTGMAVVCLLRIKLWARVGREQQLNAWRVACVDRRRPMVFNGVAMVAIGLCCVCCVGDELMFVTGAIQAVVAATVTYLSFWCLGLLEDDFFRHQRQSPASQPAKLPQLDCPTYIVDAAASSLPFVPHQLVLPRDLDQM